MVGLVVAVRTIIFEKVVTGPLIIFLEPFSPSRLANVASFLPATCNQQCSVVHCQDGKLKGHEADDGASHLCWEDGQRKKKKP